MASSRYFMKWQRYMSSSFGTIVRHKHIHKKSWINVLYDSDNDDKIDKFKQGLTAGLLTKRSQEKGDLIPYFIAQDFVAHYETLTSMQEKGKFFQILSEKLGINNNEVTENIEHLQNAMCDNSKLVHRNQQNLLDSLTAPYKHLFEDLSKLQNGVGFLVNMRKDLLVSYKKKRISKTAQLQAFDTVLREHLAQWFAGGFLDLHQISWQNTSVEIMEKAIKYEAVHPISNFEDLKTRVGHGRRIFMFSHRLIPGEPLVILYVLLGDHIPSNIQNVLSSRQWSEDGENITTATFYSISSTQRGLDGIGLGNLLIKRVVEELRKEFRNMNTFITLSPVPGFRKWLDYQIKVMDEIQDGKIHEFLDKESMEILKEKDWYLNDELSTKLERPLSKLCARYLVKEKRRGFSLDPVAHFHLRNGASLWRVNWLGNKNKRGMEASYGLMVNYKYDLSHIETNNHDYVMKGNIATSDNVQKLLES